jgi:myo-inositol-1(or 4)-monophosphatase
MAYDYDYVEELVRSLKPKIRNHAALDIRVKGQSDFVTNIDLEINQYLKGELLGRYPETSFFSEEESGRLGENCWILDPIDGTTNLILDYQMSSVSLAHHMGGRMVFGIVYNPFTDECFTAREGEGAFLNHDRRLHVSDRPAQSSVIEFGAGSTHKDWADTNFAIALDLFKHCLDIRRTCSSALAMCYIAAGRIDGYFERVIKPWDIAAGSLILAEAGGITTDYDGRPIDFEGRTTVIASNSGIHQFMMDTIGRHGDR